MSIRITECRWLSSNLLSVECSSLASSVNEHFIVVSKHIPVNYQVTFGQHYKQPVSSAVLSVEVEKVQLLLCKVLLKQGNRR